MLMFRVFNIVYYRDSHDVSGIREELLFPISDITVLLALVGASFPWLPHCDIRGSMN